MCPIFMCVIKSECVLYRYVSLSVNVYRIEVSQCVRIIIYPGIPHSTLAQASR